MRLPVRCVLPAVVLGFALLAACGGGPKADPTVPTMPPVTVTAQPQDYIELVRWTPEVEEVSGSYTAGAKLKAVKALPTGTYQLSYKASAWTKEGRREAEPQTIDFEGPLKAGDEFEITLKVPAQGPEGARTFEIFAFQRTE